jgi:hypothetical protein
VGAPGQLTQLIQQFNYVCESESQATEFIKDLPAGRKYQVFRMGPDVPASLAVSAKPDHKVAHLSFSFDKNDDELLLSMDKKQQEDESIDLPDDAFQFVAMALKNALQPSQQFV